MAYIELNNIEMGFADGSGKRRVVLRDISLRVVQGDFVAVTGVSGTGKTTLLNILGTLQRPDAGTYLFDGREVDFADEVRLRHLRSREIGFVFQDYRLLPQLSAWQNILLPTLAARRQPTEKDVAWGRMLAAQMGIDAILHQPPSSLSGGEKSRVALCRALIMRPALLLADEPTGQLDSRHAAEVAQLLKVVNEQLDTTVVLVTHSDELAQTANDIYELRDGRAVLL